MGRKPGSKDSQLLLLGPARIEHAGAPVEVDTRKAVSLLAYLAVTEQSHSRDELAGLLWPEYPQSRARAALRRTLSALGRTPARGWLEISRESVGLRPETLLVDVAEFHRLLAAAEQAAGTDRLVRLEAAAALYRGDFMAGFALRDSLAFDDWQFFQTESLRRELAEALKRLARGYEELGEHPKAIAHARRWLALDPLHETAHRTLMLLYARNGERSAALRQYRECVKILDRELGIAPLEETTRLHREIEANRLPPPEEEGAAPVKAAARPAVPARGRLAGREAEWAVLQQAYGAAAETGHLFLLEGEAGIGKTRLAEEFVESVRERGAAAVTARCYSDAAGLEYGPFAEGLSAALSGEAARARLRELPEFALVETTRLLPELAAAFDLPPPPPPNAPGARSRFFEALYRVADSVLAGPAPGVLFVDDLHLADGATRELLVYLGRRLADRPVLVLATARPAGAPTDLRRVLAEARPAGSATFLELARLDLRGVREMVRTLPPEVARELPAGFAERLHEETEGVPLFVEEYLNAAASGALSAGEEWSLSDGARSLLHGRLAAASETGRRLLEAAALVGRSFEFETVREAGGRGEEATIEALEELAALGLVRELEGAGGEPVYDFSHDKLRALVYEETSLARRKLLHRRIADALARRAGEDSGSEAGRIARHYERAGRREAAARYFRLAGEHARSLYANREAITYFEAALELGHPEPAALHEALGDLRVLLGEYAAAVASYTLADPPAPESEARLEHKLGNVYRMRGDWERAERHFRNALAGLPEEERSGLYADWSLLAHRCGDPEEAWRLAERTLELAEASGIPAARMRAHNSLGILASHRGDYPTARWHLERSLELAETLGDPGARAAALNNLALVSSAGGDHTGAIELAGRALELCAAMGDRHREAALHNNLSDFLHRRGEPEAAMEHLKAAVGIFAEIGGEKPQPEIWKLTEW